MENNLKSTPSTVAPANVAPIAAPVADEVKKEGRTMENTCRRLNRAAERRVAVANVRNAIIAAAPVAAAYFFSNGSLAAYNEVLSPVAEHAAALAAALSGKKNGEEVTVAPVPAAALIAACVTFTPKGTAKEGNRRIVWNVRKEGSIKRLFGISSVERAADCKESAVVLSEKDYLKEKAPAERAPKKPLTPFEKLANNLYTAAKIAAKADFDAVPANIEKEFIFPAAINWKKDNAVLIEGTAALMNIKAN